MVFFLNIVLLGVAASDGGFTHTEKEKPSRSDFQLFGKARAMTAQQSKKLNLGWRGSCVPPSSFSFEVNRRPKQPPQTRQPGQKKSHENGETPRSSQRKLSC